MEQREFVIARLIYWPSRYISSHFPGFSWTAAELRLAGRGRPTRVGVVEVNDWLKVPRIAFFAVGPSEFAESHLAGANEVGMMLCYDEPSGAQKPSLSS